MDAQDLEDMKSEFYDFLSSDLELTVVYREMSNAMTDSTFGIVESTGNKDTELYAASILNPEPKLKTALGVDEKSQLIVRLATKQVEDLGVVIKREAGVIIHEGKEYEILSITPLPAIFNSSVVTVLGCLGRSNV